MLATWLAPEDFVSLAECVFAAPRLGCPVIYGASNNDASFWDNSAVAHLGWRLKRNSAEFAEKINRAPPLAKDDPLMIFQGGRFTSGPVIEE